MTPTRDTLINLIEGESMLLNLNSEGYFGLDPVGTRMWTQLADSDSIQSAYEALLRKAGQTGRPRVKGARRPSPQQILDNPKTKWTKIEVDHWYGGQERVVEVYTETAIWYCCRNMPVQSVGG
jgi:hypothetical protein